MKIYFPLMMLSFLLISSTSAVLGDDALYSFKVFDIDGKSVDLSQFKGKVMLIVNTASMCGFTPQYKSLEGLYEKYQKRGLVILGFPANNFMGQEPGTNQEIKKFCSFRYKVTFPMFAKVSVSGSDMHPLYQYLTSRPNMSGPITWNFNKFLVDSSGHVIARFDSSVDPMSQEVISAVEKLLPL